MANTHSMHDYSAQVDVQHTIAETEFEDAEASDDSCSCKKDSGSAKFVCGVALAFSISQTELHEPVASKQRYLMFDTQAWSSVVDHLKRPPRFAF